MSDDPLAPAPPPEESPRRRPWKVTYAGGRTLSTFRYQENALLRAQEVIRSGRLHTVWVRKRGASEVLRIGRNRNEPPPSVDEGL